jgi:CheY-like chemotaxis protein
METILISEDDDMLRDIWERALSKRGYKVATVTNGQEAIDWLNNNPLPRAIVTDFNMPLRDGAAVIDEVDELDPDRRVTRVVISANHNLQYDELTERIDLLLVKPVRIRDIADFVERLVARA